MRNKYIYHEVMISYIGGDSIVADSIKTSSIHLDIINPPLSEKRLQTLRLLAREGPTSVYQISREIDMRYSVAHGAIKHLERQGFVKLGHMEEGRKGTVVKIYGLTVLGIAAIITDPEAKEHIDEIAGRWKHLLPLVLGKWEHFKRYGVQDVALIQLEFAAKNHLTGAWLTRDFGLSLRPQEPMERFTYDFYNPFGMALKPEEYERWVKAVREDEEIKGYVLTLTTRMVESLTRELSGIEEYREEISGRGLGGDAAKRCGRERVNDLSGFREW